MMTQDQLERERYEARLRLQRDQSSLLRDAHNRGLEEGIEKGIEKGRLIGQIQLCQQLLKRPLSSREELLAQTFIQLEQMAQHLDQQLRQTAP